jgi:FkbM family methyltransferase
VEEKSAVEWRRTKKFLNFLLDTRGQSISTTAKIIFNKAVYLASRTVRKTPEVGLVHADWHWAKYPFSLRHRILWSSALRGWFIPEDESAIECMLHMPSYEPIEWVTPIQGEYFLDAGGYVGWYSILAARAVGNSGGVVTLEPDPLNRRQLEVNLSLNKLENVRILPLAIWSSSGRVKWQQGEEPVWHQISEAGETTLESISVDDLIRSLGLLRLDWIKLDIEGGEVEALRGAERTLREYRPKLFIEVHGTTQIVAKLLQEVGYTISRELYDQPPDRHGWILAEKS